MPTLESLTAEDLRAVIRGYADALAAHRETINRLNVYPVPDGDTGTNMALTLTSVVAELDAADSDMASVCAALAHGSLMGARGNSGVILSQILRGMAGVFADRGGIDAGGVADALEAASAAAYGAVMRPVEGTILTVARVAAEGARRAADAGADLTGVLEAAREGGADALARTPELLPVLAEAGVVDAGGTGLLLLLDVALSQVDGRPVPEPDEDACRCHRRVPPGVRGRPRQRRPRRRGGRPPLRGHVLPRCAGRRRSAAFKDVWATLGDSIVVVGGDGLWNCHIHTDDIGASIEAAVEIGRPRGIRVTDLLGEVEEERWVREAEPMAPEPATVHEPVPCAVVAVAVGDGIRRIFHSLGVQVVVTGGQTMNPSTAQLLEAVESAPAPEVVILPNNKNIIPVAEQVDAMTDKTVRVVPTRGVAEGFASLLAYDPGADVRDQRRRHGRRRRTRGGRRGHPGGARLQLATVARSATATGSGSHPRASSPSTMTCPVPPPRCSTSSSAPSTRSSPSSRATAPPRRSPATSRSGCTTTGPGARSRSTTAASPSTPTSSASSSRYRAMARRLSQLAQLPVTELKGVGDARAGALAKLGVRTVLDLLTYYPRRYLDRTNQARLEDLEVGEEATVLVSVVRSPVPSHPQRQVAGHRRRHRRHRLACRSRFFNQPLRERQLKEGTDVVLFGKLEVFQGQRRMTNPVVDLIGDRTGRIVPVYPQSEKAGVMSWDVARFLDEVLERAGEFADPLDEELRDRLDLVDRTVAFHGIHGPESMREAAAARRRLVFDELLRVQLELVRRKRELERTAVGIAHDVGDGTGGPLVERFHQSSPTT